MRLVSLNLVLIRKFMSSFVSPAPPQISISKRRKVKNIIQRSVCTVPVRREEGWISRDAISLQAGWDLELLELEVSCQADADARQFVEIRRTRSSSSRRRSR